MAFRLIEDKAHVCPLPTGGGYEIDTKIECDQCGARYVLQLLTGGLNYANYWRLYRPAPQMKPRIG